MRKGKGVRAAFLGLNLLLIAATGGLLHTTLRFGGGQELEPLLPTRFAVSSAGADRADAGQWAIVWRELDRPRPEATPPPPVQTGPASGDLEAAWDLICVMTDPDPFRSSAIVSAASGGAQASLGPGDPFAGGTVAGIEVAEEAGRRCARLRVQLPDRVQCLEMPIEVAAAPDR